MRNSVRGFRREDGYEIIYNVIYTSLKCLSTTMENLTGVSIIRRATGAGYSRRQLHSYLGLISKRGIELFRLAVLPNQDGTSNIRNPNQMKFLKWQQKDLWQQNSTLSESSLEAAARKDRGIFLPNTSRVSHIDTTAEALVNYITCLRQCKCMLCFF